MYKLLIALALLFAPNCQAIWLIDTEEHPVCLSQVNQYDSDRISSVEVEGNRLQMVAISMNALLGISKEPLKKVGKMSINGRSVVYRITSFKWEDHYFVLCLFDEDINKSCWRLRAVLKDDVVPSVLVSSAYGGRVITTRPASSGLEMSEDPSYKDFLGCIHQKNVSHMVAISERNLILNKKQKTCSIDIPQDRFMLTQNDVGTALLDNLACVMGFALPDKTAPQDFSVNSADIGNGLVWAPLVENASKFPSVNYLYVQQQVWKACHPKTKMIFLAEALVMGYVLSQFLPLMCSDMLYYPLPIYSVMLTMLVNQKINKIMSHKTQFHCIDHYFKLQDAYKLYRDEIDPQSQAVFDELEDQHPKPARFYCITPAVQDWINSEVKGVGWRSAK